MDKPLTIPRIEEDEDTDFETFYKNGIKKIQELSGNLWTDYNAHDPGITIFENLCYSLTELISRTEIPIQNLLTQKNGKFVGEKNAMYHGSDILVNAALTVGDYSKIIVDRIREVKNAWVVPYYYYNPFTNNKIGIAGMYKVMVDLEDELAGNETIENKVKEEVTLLLANNRMLTELFPIINILKPVYLTISFHLYLNKSSKPEETLALILFNLVNFINPSIQSFTYDEMIGMGYTLDEIFEGPKLKNGFIPDTQLTDRTSVIYTDELLKLIIQTPGVNSVNSLALSVSTFLNPQYLHAGDLKTIEDLIALKISDNIKPVGQYTFPDSCSLLLNLPESLDNIKNIKVFVEYTPYEYNKNLVISIFNRLRSKRKGTGSFVFPNQETNKLPIGKYVNPSAYYSIQNEFPAIYGIGKEKLGKKSSLERKAQALQLKSYLMFYEQILADFMAQIENIAEIFSVSNQDRTYFFQPLYSVPDAPILLKGFNGSGDSLYDSEKGNTYLNDYNNFKSNNQNEYIIGLEKQYKKFDNFNSRRNSFLDHLLARFNFRIHPHPQLSKSADNEASMLNVEIKQELLSNMLEITSYRGRGRVEPTSKATEEDIRHNKSLDIFLHTLSGIKYGNPRIISKGTYYSVLKIVSKAESKDIFKQHKSLPLVYVNKKNEHFNEVIRAGRYINNYETEITKNEVTFYLKLGTSRLKLFTKEKTENDKDHTKELNLFISDFYTIFLHYENIFLIEHILLKPLNTEKKFVAVNQLIKEPISELVGYEYDTLLEQIGKNKEKQDFVIWVKTNSKYIHQDFYSSRVSIVLPLSAADEFKMVKGYQEYFYSLVLTNLPAHICFDVFWLDETKYTEFIPLYKNFLSEDADSKEKLSLFLINQESLADSHL